jgi:hypothetical protein
MAQQGQESRTWTRGILKNDDGFYSPRGGWKQQADSIIRKYSLS